MVKTPKKIADLTLQVSIGKYIKFLRICRHFQELPKFLEKFLELLSKYILLIQSEKLIEI